MLHKSHMLSLGTVISEIKATKYIQKIRKALQVDVSWIESEYRLIGSESLLQQIGSAA